MAKILRKIITYCNECPYLEYDPYYDRRNDSGYDCNLKEKRLINDYEITDRNSFIIEIPEWCPLEDWEDENE